MAREAQDREDLLAEATALVERVELTVAGFAETLVIGFRRDGCASFYFGADPAWHFNTRQELRRAYVGGILYKADHCQMREMRRGRATDKIQLVTHQLGEAEHARLIRAIEDSLARVQAGLMADEYRIVGQVPVDGAVVPRIVRWLELASGSIVVAASPYAR